MATEDLSTQQPKKANAMADTLETAFMPNDDPSCKDNIEHVEHMIEQYERDNQHPPVRGEDVCSPKEVLGLINQLKTKKAPGMDKIPNIALKQLPPSASIYLANLFNDMIRMQYFSTAMKESKVILFPKPGKNAAFPQNYRPISLLSSFSKIFEGIIY
jgi:hypothetical protein